MDAFARGVQDGVNMLIAVVAMLLAAVAFVALVNMIFAAAFPEIGGSGADHRAGVRLEISPFMWMLGIPWRDALPAGELMGTKTVLNELIAYLDMSRMASDVIEPRTRLMMIYALCGFANFASVAIMIGGLSSICPERRDDFADLGLKSLLAGTLTNMLSAALIGWRRWPCCSSDYFFALALERFAVARISAISRFWPCAPSPAFSPAPPGSASAWNCIVPDDVANAAASGVC